MDFLLCAVVIITLRPKQNGCNFADDSLKGIFLNKNVWIAIKCHWSLFLRVQLTIFSHRCRQWLGGDQMTCHYLNHWWLYCRRIWFKFPLPTLAGKHSIATRQQFCMRLRSYPRLLHHTYNHTHFVHLIRSRSRNKHQNLLDGQYVSSLWEMVLIHIVITNCVVICNQYSDT